MSALFADLRFALRMLVKSPGYTFVAIVTLAVAIAANTAIFSAVNVVLLRPLPYPEPEQLVSIFQTRPDQERMTVSYPDYLDYRARNSSFSTLAAAGIQFMALTGKGEAENTIVQNLSHDYLPMMGVTPLLGRNFLPEEDAPNGPRAALLSHGVWTRRYAADPAMVGRKITLDGGEWTVVGVLREDFHPMIVGTAVFLPLGVRASEAPYLDRAAHPEVYLFGRMKPDVTLAQARADMQAIGDELARRFPEQVGTTRPLVLSLREEIVQDVRMKLLLLLAAVGCVLLIAAANIANLTLERAMTRQRELSIRSALGASRWRLVRQMLVESLVVAVAGGALGLLLALWSVDVMNAVRPNGPAFATQGAIEIDATVLVYTAAVTLGTGLLFGLVPALIASRQDLAQALKDADHHASSGGRPLRARNLLVVAEVALALMLAVAAALATRSLASLHRTDLGFKVDNLMVAVVIPPPDRYPTSAALVQFWSTLARRVAAIPGIEAAAVSSGVPGLIGGHETFYAMGVAQTPENANVALAYRVDVGVPETLQLPLLAGRTCGEQDAPGTVPVVVVGRRLAEKFFPGQDPVGQRLQETLSKQPSVEIVGVVGDVRHEGLEGPEATPYQMHYCYRQLPLDAQKDMIMSTTMHLLARAGDESMDLAPQVRAALAEVDPMAPTWGINTVGAILKNHLGAREFTVRLLSVFAALALLLAAIGLYAVMANTVVQRTRELGVRLALGAQPRAIVALVVGQGMRLVAIGLCIGLVGALALTQVMETLLTDAISATDPPTYLGVIALLVAVGLLATWLPARRATRVDPMIAMRHD